MDMMPLDEYRKTSGLTQERSAGLCGVGVRTWQNWERGKTKMPAGLLELFEVKVRALGLLRAPERARMDAANIRAVLRAIGLRLEPPAAAVPAKPPAPVLTVKPAAPVQVKPNEPEYL